MLLIHNDREQWRLCASSLNILFRNFDVYTEFHNQDKVAYKMGDTFSALSILLFHYSIISSVA